MADKIQVGEAVLKMTLDVHNVMDGVAKSKEAVNGMVDDTKKGITAFKAAWGGAALAIGAFIVKSIADYNKLDQAISNVVKASEHYGIKVDNLRGRVESYLDTMETSTRFQDTELANSLLGLTGKTKDLGQAMYLNNLAADLSVRKGIPLAQAAEMLGNLYAGNTRGMAAMARELGIVGEENIKASVLFKRLREDVEGAAQAEDNQAVTLKKLGTAYANVGESIGKALVPLSNWAMAVAKIPADMWSSLFGSDAEKALGKLKEAEANMANFQKLHNSAPTVGFYADSLKYWTKQVELLKSSNKELTKNTDALKDQGKVVDDKIRKDEERARAKAIGMDQERKFNEDMEKSKDRQEKQTEKQKEAYMQMGAALAGSVTNDMTAFFDMVIKGNATLGQSFEALGKAMAKGVLNGIAQVIEGYAAEAYGKAIISAISEDYVGAAEDLAAGAALSASAAGVRAMANNLADGAMITGGSTAYDSTPANLRKNEGVIPFDDPRAVTAMVEALNRSGVQGGGGSKIQIGQVVVNGADRGAAKSAAYALAEEIDKVEQRKGQRGRRSSGN